ncbi:MAG: hypothetical protein NVS3B21_36550 [Acidimicrobiales bacterium]
MTKKTKVEHWQAKPAEHDYPAAVDFLSLLVPDDRASAVVADLRQAAIVRRKAKDILRASGLAVLSSENAEVRKDLEKIRLGTKLSPVLLVRGDLATGRSLVVADGYHRVCASYHLDEDADIPCKVVDLPGES